MTRKIFDWFVGDIFLIRYLIKVRPASWHSDTTVVVNDGNRLPSPWKSACTTCRSCNNTVFDQYCTYNHWWNIYTETGYWKCPISSFDCSKCVWVIMLKIITFIVDFKVFVQICKTERVIKTLLFITWQYWNSCHTHTNASKMKYAHIT